MYELGEFKERIDFWMRMFNFKWNRNNKIIYAFIMSKKEAVREIKLLYAYGYIAKKA